MAVPGRRPQRLGEQIREEISALLLSGLKDPRIGFATITAVRLTPDLRQARVAVGVLGPAAEQERTLAGLQAARGFIRRELAHRLSIRRMPELSFELDRSAEQAARIEELLQKSRQGNRSEDDSG
ncbi:MAG: 30S ribosome-binding factor RbfA [Terriglobia bacterium]